MTSLRCALGAIVFCLAFAKVSSAQSLAEHEFKIFDTAELFPQGSEQHLLAQRLAGRRLGVNLLPEPTRMQLVHNVLRWGQVTLEDDSLEITHLSIADALGGYTWHFDGGFSDSRVATLVAPIEPTATGVRFLHVNAAEAHDLIHHVDPKGAMHALSRQPGRLQQARKASIHRSATPHAHGQGLRLRAWYGRKR